LGLPLVGGVYVGDDNNDDDTYYYE
jgi:hypothetical protein